MQECGGASAVGSRHPCACADASATCACCVPVLLACGGCSAPAVEVRHAVGAARCVDIPVQLEQADAHAVLPLRLQVPARLRAVLGDEGELVRDARGLEQRVEAGELQRPLGVLGVLELE